MGSIFDAALASQVAETHWWLNQMIGQLIGDKPWLLDPGPDPMSDVRTVDRLRIALEAAGIEVPRFVEPDTDPLANMIAWRDFLAKLVTVH